MEPNSLREEFEKAFQDNFGDVREGYLEALWAAQWMAERCAEEAINTIKSPEGRYYGDLLTGRSIAENIRQLAKELQ